MLMTIAEFANITPSQSYASHVPRERLEQVLALAAHLGDDDRLLIEQVYEHGMSPTEVACLLGKRPRSVRARLEQILRHIRSAEFRFMVLRGQRLPRATREVGRVVVLERHSLRQAANLLGCSLHHVRQHMQVIQALMQA